MISLANHNPELLKVDLSYAKTNKLKNLHYSFKDSHKLYDVRFLFERFLFFFNQHQ